MGAAPLTEGMPVRVKGWSSRSGLAKVDLYTRGTVHLIVWVGVLGLTLLLLGRPVRGDGQLVLVVTASLLALAEGVLCGRLARHAMDAYLGQGQVPRRLVSWAAAVTAGATTAVVVLAATADLTGLLPTMLAAALAPFLAVHSLLVSNRTTTLIQLVVLVVVCGMVSLTGRTADEVLFTVVTTGFANGWMAFTARWSMWVLAVMWKLREARDVQARLAVAEERLRFGRDLHDVMGRNLAVIALKSELAVQLARRGRPEAVDQMTEVQRIAQESQREVRDVVRGYREADLSVELAGAWGVLAAAGISCTVRSGDAELPVGVQSALGWVVREATTNVLRHGDARRCTISLRTADDTVVLVVENDGAAEAAAGTPGSGLAGLRERLSAVDGTLEAGPARGGRFRLTARVPLGQQAGQDMEEAV
ncbi:sensor histidine kinase [Streptomyces lunaelactis]|nr:sensor histidine kinase [Streptomyces lunaelactis]NUK36054.1 sensor histidine kinase [Streptomyces lunaelactis]NUK43827.1 sensor histidine kinase [Streptomyces lunaelactis]NUK58942.1 sensor histidine kinase [Streptomyces lunaelactis]NUK93138.1 sensor histidine kinase [Streptomyces lunaelactis]